MNQETHRIVISGQASGPSAAMRRALLDVMAWPYSLAIRLRNSLYSQGLLRSHKAGAAVISVGNLTTGGTGKTPLVVWLCEYVRQKQMRCAVLTRGYRMRKGRLSDEPAVLAARCPDVPVIVNPNRVAGAREAIRACEADVLVLDDGFQHRRLSRDLDIVTIDATAPFGYGRLLPAGLLREPLTGLRRADAVVITRSDQVSEERLQQIECRVRQVNPGIVLASAVHAPISVKAPGRAELGLEELRGKRVLAFCGLGNPQAFYDTIRRLGCLLVGSQSFNDHHRYTRDCLDRIYRRAEEANVDCIVTTEKDWTKIEVFRGRGDHRPLAYLAVELQFVAGAEPFRALIDRVLSGTIVSLHESRGQV